MASDRNRGLRLCPATMAIDEQAFFLVIAALNLAGGSWYLTIDRDTRTG